MLLTSTQEKEKALYGSSYLFSVEKIHLKTQSKDMKTKWRMRSDPSLQSGEASLSLQEDRHSQDGERCQDSEWEEDAEEARYSVAGGVEDTGGHCQEEGDQE